MALGQPFLAVWGPSDQTLRLFRMSENGFVQVATTALAHNTGAVYQPKLAWLHDSDILLALNQSATVNTSAGALLTTFSQTLAQLAQTNPSVGSTLTVPRAYAIARKANGFLGFVPSSAPAARAYTTTPTGTFSGLATPANSATSTFAEISAEDAFLFAYENTSCVVRKKSGDLANGAPNYATATFTLSDIASAPLAAKWSPTEPYLVIATEANLFMYSFTESEASLLQVIPLTEAGTPYAVAWRYDNRFVAIGYDNNGTRTVVVYKRTGPTLTKVQTLTGSWGSLLGFTADGKYLVDAAGRQAWEYQAGGVFVEANSIMANIPVGCTLQAISTHTDNPLGTGKVFPVALEKLLPNDFQTLKLMLLSSDATFNSQATTASAVSNSGANEVSGYGWPAGGLPLLNIEDQVRSGGFIARVADNVKQTIAGGNLVFRRAMIYEEETDMPVIFIDFPEDQTAEADLSAVFNFQDAGFVRFVT